MVRDWEFSVKLSLTDLIVSLIKGLCEPTMCLYLTRGCLCRKWFILVSLRLLYFTFIGKNHLFQLQYYYLNLYGLGFLPISLFFILPVVNDLA